MRLAPRLAGHEEDYQAAVRRARDGTEVEIEHAKWEDSTLGDVELNLIRSTVVKPRFRLSNMHKRLPLGAMALAKGGDEWALGNIKHTSKKVYTYLTNKSKHMVAAPAHVEYGVTREPWDPSDDVMSRVSAALPSLGSTHITPINTSIITSRFRLKSDMRHMFLKGYLYLMDYTLARTSKTTQMATGKYDVDILENISMKQRLAAMVSREVVVDVGVMSRDEVRMLALLGSSYPVVKYCDDNVYNSHRLDKDDVLLISDTDIKVDVGMTFTSPDTFYNILMSLATKLDVLDDVHAVFSGYRGVPFVLDDITEVTGQVTYGLHYPKSRHLTSSLECRPGGRVVLTNFSNYYSSSICVLMDLLLGEALQVGVLNMMDGLCATSSVGVPTGAPNTDDVFNDSLRNYGLKSDDVGMNGLLLEWACITSEKMPVSFGGLKDYAVSWLERLMANNWTWKGCQQVALMLTSSYYKESTIGSQRGWSANPVISGDEQVSHAAATKSFGFLMGVSDTVPRTLLDVDDYLTVPEMTTAELDLMMGRSGEYKIRGVWFNISCDTEAYADMREVTLVTFHTTRYKGCGFHLVYDPTTEGERMAVLAASEADEAKVMETLGLKTVSDAIWDAEITGVTFGGSIKRPGDRGPNVSERLAIHVEPEPVTPTHAHGYAIGLPAIRIPGLEKADSRRAPVIADSLGDIEKGFASYPTRGDGKCGIHGVVQDLAVHGFIEPRNYMSAFRRLRGSAVEKEWHTETDLAGLVTRHGFGLQVVAKDGGGGWRSRVYGGDGAKHIVRLKNENGHWENIVPGPNPWSGGLTIDRNTTSPSEVTSSLDQLGQLVVFG